MTTLRSPATRKDAADTLSVASSAIKPSRTGIGQKLALVPVVYRLAKRYPMPALVIGGLALVYYMSQRHAGTPVVRH
ncbi:MAG TPA: hypothetical protein VFS52_11050 [Steroidobacteraceae bacterium]|jgi:hypothetical protein|nr:hypothetical protein [Steroidobacteraceae bacterium]